MNEIIEAAVSMNTLQNLRVSDTVLNTKFQESLQTLEYLSKKANRNKLKNFSALSIVEEEEKDLKQKLLERERLAYIYIRIYREQKRAKTDREKEFLSKILHGLATNDSKSIKAAEKFLFLQLEEKRERRISNNAANLATIVSDHVSTTKSST